MRDENNNVGERIRERRIALGMTQTQLAEKLGYVSRSTIRKIESGVNQMKQNKILDFAVALETTPVYLLGMVDDPEMPIEQAIHEFNKPGLELIDNRRTLIKLLEKMNYEDREINIVLRYLDLTTDNQKAVDNLVSFLFDKEKDDFIKNS